MTWGMILGRLAFIMRAYKARVGPLETMSIIPIRSFLMNRPWQRTSLLLAASRRVTPNGCTERSGSSRSTEFPYGQSISAVDPVQRFTPCLLRRHLGDHPHRATRTD